MKSEVKMSNQGNYLGEEVKRVEKDKLLEEFKKFQFSLEIIDEARKVWDEVAEGTKKCSRRKKLFFFSLYVAHIRLKVVQDYEYVAEQVGLEPNAATRSFIEFSETKTGFKMPLVEFKVVDFLNIYIQRLNIEKDQKDILNIYEELCQAKETHEKKKLLKATKPQNVATAIIDLYHSQKCSRMTERQYKLLYKKKETINTVKTKIIHVLCN